MASSRSLNVVIALWIAAVTASFAVLALAPATGDGFTRGLDRALIFLGLQLLATVLAVFAWLQGARARREGRAGGRWISRAPLLVSFAIFAALAATITIRALAQEPLVSPTLEARSEPETQTAIEDGPALATYRGYFRHGFEQSAFFPEEGGGPWWLETVGMAWKPLMAHLIQRPGRGSGMTLELEIRGRLIAGDTGYGHLGDYEAQIEVVDVISARPISEEQFDEIANARAGEER